MRVTAFKAWVTQAMRDGAGAARRAGHAITRRIREAAGKVEAGVGVGDDESSFGGGRGSRAWFELLGEYVQKLVRLFDKSKFEKRFAKVDRFLRRLLGLPERIVEAPKLPPPRRSAPPRAPMPVDPEQARLMRDQIRLGRVQANAAGQFAKSAHRPKRSKPAPKRVYREGEEPEDDEEDREEDQT